MRNSKYHWENYTKEGLNDWEQEKKDLEEEETLATLLNHMVKNQTNKILKAQS